MIGLVPNPTLLCTSSAGEILSSRCEGLGTFCDSVVPGLWERLCEFNMGGAVECKKNFSG